MLIYLCNTINVAILVSLIYRYQHIDNARDRILLGAGILVFVMLIPINMTVLLHVLGGKTPWQIYMLATLAMQVASSAAYFAVVQARDNRVLPWRELLHHRVVISTAALSMIMVISDYSRRAHYLWLFDSSAVDRSWAFAISELCFGGVFAYTGWHTLCVYQDELATHENPLLLSRVAVMASAYIIGMGGALLLMLNTLLTLIIPSYDGIAVRWFVWQVNTPAVFIIFALGTFTPQWVFRKLQPFIIPYWQRRQQQNDHLLCYLHEHMIKLVPDAFFPAASRSRTDRMIEINDARRRLWSHIPNHRRMTAKAEAQAVMTFFQRGQTLRKAGMYPPPTFPKGIARYNFTVARELKRLSGHTRIS